MTSPDRGVVREPTHSMQEHNPMAQEQSGPIAKAPWTKIFTAFKVALDMKKLLLAAAGIVLVALGWWLISLTFYNTRSFPEW